MRRIIAVTTLLSIGLLAAAEKVALPSLEHEATVHFDQYAIPHIYAGSWTDAARVLGYIHASERLWQMDFMRRFASGTLAEVAGEDMVQHDIEMRRLGIRRSTQEWWDSGNMPEEFRAEMEAYAEGVNAYLDQLTPDALPPLFQGRMPEAWHPVDSISWNKYMGWDQGGTDDDLWFGMLVDKLGVEATDTLWPLERPYEIPTVKTQAARPASHAAAQDDAAFVDGLAPVFEMALRELSNAGRYFGRGGAFGSNNWAIDGTKTKSGKPILCSDPHLGFDLPSMWYAAHISVDGFNVAGTMFPVAPYIVIGHNDRVGWGITNMQADAVDYFVETMHPEDPAKYQHLGEWRDVERRVETIRVAGKDPLDVTLEYTAHGAIITREGAVIAQQWTGFGETKDGLSLWMLNRAKTLKDGIAALDELAVPALNMVFADADGNIMIHPCGRLPIRAGGNGRIPMDGASGANDWQGWIPRDELPLAINPDDHYVASANGRPHPLGYPHYIGWMWDPSYRTRRIADMLSTAEDMTVEKMIPLQVDAYDKAAENFLPVLIGDLDPAKITDPFAKEIYAIAKDWDYVASGDSKGPIVFYTWFGEYRSGVWNDEWAARGITQPGGSWGFSGDNRREPVLEVLEYVTKNVPKSKWFDDQTTKERETREAISRAAFDRAVEKLRERSGGDIEKLAWDQINILSIGHMTGIEELGREGWPVAGAGFTVNPGSEGGLVGGGASWRYIVDFGDPGASIGVYPGGQSGDPASKHYDDLIPLWAEGKYVKLHAVGDPDALPSETKARTVMYAP